MAVLQLEVIIDAVDKASAKVTETTNGITKTVGGVAKVAGAVFAAAETAVVGFAGSAVNAGMDFDSAMSQVAATMGTSVDKIGELRDFAKEMGASTAFSATQAAEALNYMALAGYDATTSMNMLPTVLDLAAAGGIELAEASDMVTDAQSALGLSIEETSAMVDQMAAASSKTNTSVAQLGQAFLTIGGTARNLKGGTAELSAALGLLADNGIKASEGGTALRNILLNMSQEKFENTFGALGVSAYDAEGNMRSLKDVFADMNEAMADMTVEEKTKTLSEAFNKVDLKSLNALLATNGERWDEVTEAIENSEGAASKMAETQLDNLAGDITLFQSALEGLQIAFSDRLTPSLRDFVQYAGTALQDLTTAFEEGGVEGFMDKFSEVLAGGLALIGEKVPEFVNAGAMLLGAIGEGLASAFASMFESLGSMDIGGHLAGMMNNAAAAISSNGPAVMEGAKRAFSQILSAISSSTPEIMDGVKNLVSSLASLVAESAPDLLSAAAEFIGEFVPAVIDALPDIIASLLEVLGEIVATIPDWGPKLLSAAYEMWLSINRALANIVGVVLATLGNVVGRLVGAVAGKAGQMLGAARQFFQGFVSGITQKAGEVARAVGNAVQRAVDRARSFGSSLIGAGRDFIQGFINGVMQKAGEIASAARNAVENAISAAKSALKIGSPSKLFMQFGEWTMEGYAIGLERMAHMAEQSMERAAQGVYDAASGRIEVYAGYGGTKGLEALSAAQSNVSSDVYNVYLNIEDPNDFNSMATAFTEAIQTTNRLAGRRSAMNVRFA